MSNGPTPDWDPLNVSVLRDQRFTHDRCPRWICRELPSDTRFAHARRDTPARAFQMG